MADENIDLQLNLDASGFVQGANQAGAAAAQAASQFGSAERNTHMLGKALSLASPGRLTTGFGAAVAAAGLFQQQTQGVAATARVTGQSMESLSHGMNALARSFPVGQRGAIEVVSTLQQLGYSGKNQIKVIDDMAKGYIRLGAATSSSSAVVGRQMTMLSRAFGATDSNISRFTKMSDSLTGVTAKIGGSATDVLAFSKSIAPMARQAGIGQTAVMGISSAFSKMGEDGYLASNAMSKVLNDLNRSVRDGSGEMNTYANIVGKTRSEFEQLFKMNPTQAVQDVLASLAAPGATGARNAERIGLDGVRTQRVLQGLAQQGGIQPAVATAISEYGSGSTKRASDVAMGGLYDQFGKLASAAEQVTAALGTPFLGAVSKAVQVLSVPVRGAARVAESGLVQNAIKYGLPLVMGYLGVRALGAVGLGLATGRQVVNNGLVRGFTEGNRMGFAGSGPVGPMTRAQADGRLANMGFYGKATDFTTRMGQGFGQARAQFRDDRNMARWQMYMNRGMGYDEAYQRATAPGPTIGQRLRQAPRAVMNTLWGGQRLYNQAMQESARMLREQDPTLRRMRSPFRFQRENPLPPGVQGPQGPAVGSMGKLDENLRTAWRSAGTFSERISRVGTTLGQAAGSAATASGGFRTAGRIVVTSLENTAIGLRAFGAAVRASGIGGMAVRGGMRAAGALLNPYMIAMMGGGALISNISGNREKDKQQAEEFASRSVTSSLDAYRDSMGSATDATVTFSQQISEAGNLLMRSVNSVSDAAKITEADRAFAGKTQNQIVQRYGGSNASIVEQIRAMSPGGLTSKDLQAVKEDLLRQRPDDDVRSIISALTQGSGGDRTAGGAPNYRAMFGGALGRGNGATGMDQFRRVLLGQQNASLRGWGIAGVVNSGIGSGITNVLDYLGAGGGGFGHAGDQQRVGSNFNREELRSDQRTALDQVTAGIGQTYNTNADKYGQDYAVQERARAANEAYKQIRAASHDNKDVMAALAKDLTNQLGGKDNRMLISSDEVDKYGGFVQAYQAKNKNFREKSAGVDLNPDNGTPGLSPVLQINEITKATQGIAVFGQALSMHAQDVTTSLNKATGAFLETPGDMDKFRKAMAEMTAAGTKSGMDLTQLGGAALQTVRALGDATSDASKLASAVFERAYSDNEANAGFQGRAVTSRNRRAEARQLMQSADATPEGQQRFDRGRSLMQSQKEDDRQSMVSRLQMYFQYNKQVARATEDFNLQRKYANEDFNKSVDRANEDYNVSRLRAYRDFTISMSQAQEDFNISRARAQRDFNKQLKRENEDAAKAMYDPFKRIQVQAVMDAATLMVNLREQNNAMAQQAKNLQQLRKMGLSNDAIDQLGLNKSENAQQAQRMVADLVDGATSAQAINAMIAERMKDAGVLASDSSQKDRQRAQEDFNQSLKDQNQDFTKSIARSRAQFSRSMNDMAQDFAKSMARNQKDFDQQMERQRKAFDTTLTREKQDIQDSQKEILGSFEELANAVEDSMAGRAVNFQSFMHDTLAATVADAKQFAKDNPDIFGGTYSGPGPTPAPSTNQKGLGSATQSFSVKKGQTVTPTGGYDLRAVNKGDTRTLIEDLAGMSGANLKVSSTNGGKHADGSFHYKNQALDFTGTGKDMDKLSNFIWGLNWNHKIRATELIHRDSRTGQMWGIKDGQPKDYGEKLWKEHEGHVHLALSGKDAEWIATHYGGGAVKGKGGLATGGIVTAPVASWVGEGGSHEAVIPLNAQGVNALAKAMTQYISGPDAQRMLAPHTGDRVTYTGNFTYDYSTQVTGPITVKADDPNAMMRALEAKKRRSNLTTAPQRKGGR